MFETNSLRPFSLPFKYNLERKKIGWHGSTSTQSTRANRTYTLSRCVYFLLKNKLSVTVILARLYVFCVVCTVCCVRIKITKYMYIEQKAVHNVHHILQTVFVRHRHHRVVDIIIGSTLTARIYVRKIVFAWSRRSCCTTLFSFSIVFFFVHHLTCTQNFQ